MLTKVISVVLIFVATATSCRREEKFPAIGEAMASPIDVEVFDSGEYFYVLNADFDRTYNKGSVVVLDQEGNKVKAIEVPRLGRSIMATDKDLIVTTDYPDDDNTAFVLLFDITNPADPVLKKEFGIACSPLNTAIRKNYDYFFVTCSDGTLHIGKLEADRTQSWIKRIRQYARTTDTTRRALYLDPKRELLFGFTTDVSKQLTADREAEDSRTFNNEAEPVLNDAGESVSDEVPDDYQSTRREIAASGSRVNYQFFVYDIRAEKDNAPQCTVSEEEDCKFPVRGNNEPVVQKELRWLYFNLNNFDGTPDTANSLNPAYKYYRTNFWDAKPDPYDPDVFYLSHRGNPKKSAYSNQIVRVQFIGDIRVSADGKVPHTGDVFTFERISGFKAEGLNGTETTKLHFPGDFELAEIGGQRVLVVNHFRDIASGAWLRGEVYFSVTAKTLDENSWFSELPGSLDAPNVTTYYQIAINKSGRALTTSFYGNAVILLEVTPGVGIREIKRIE
jgi:hypothetical protein